jgi:hypothetical protein
MSFFLRKKMTEKFLDSVERGDFITAGKLASPLNVNSVGSDISERTPLIIAVQNGDIDMVSLLLKKGADQTIRDHDEKTPLLYALEYNDLDMIRLLLNNLTFETAVTMPGTVEYLHTANKHLQRLFEYKHANLRIPSRFEVKEIIHYLFNLTSIPHEFFVILRAEYGDQFVTEFNKFLTKFCNLDEFFPRRLNFSKYLAGGTYGIAFALCVNDFCDPPIALKIVPYSQPEEKKSASSSSSKITGSKNTCTGTRRRLGAGKYYYDLPIDNETRPENVEWEMLRRINNIFEKIKFPHIPLAYDSFKCKLSKDPPTPLYNFIAQFVDVGAKDFKRSFQKDTACCRITFLEFAEAGALENFIQQPENEPLIESLIFQVLVAMATLLRHMPNFRHNDFHMGNLLLRASREHITGEINGRRYLVKNPKVRVLLNDFDFSHALPEMPNAKYRDLNLPDKNLDPTPYSDMFKFFNSFITVMPESRISEGIRKFVNYVVPPNLQGHKVKENNILIVDYFALNFRDTLLEGRWNIGDLVPSRLIGQPFFDKFFLE